MSFITQKERIFRVRRTRAAAAARRTKGNLRALETCKDLRLVSMDCFDRHQALIDALTGREADLMGDDSEGEDLDAENRELREEIEALKKECRKWNQKEESWRQIRKESDREKSVSRMSIASLQAELLRLRQETKEKDRQIAEYETMGVKLAQDNEKALQLMRKYEQQDSTFPAIEKEVKGLKKEVSGLTRTSISDIDSKEKLVKMRDDYEERIKLLMRQLAEAENMLHAYEEQLRDLPAMEGEIERLKQMLMIYQKQAGQVDMTELNELRALVKHYEQQLAELPAMERELEELRRLVLKLQKENEHEITTLEKDVKRSISKLTNTNGDEISALKKKLADMQAKCEEDIKALTVKHKAELEERLNDQKSKGEKDTEKAEVTQVQEKFAELQKRCEQEKEALEAELKRLREQYQKQLKGEERKSRELEKSKDASEAELKKQKDQSKRQLDGEIKRSLDLSKEAADWKLAYEAEREKSNKLLKDIDVLRKMLEQRGIEVPKTIGEAARKPSTTAGKPMGAIRKSIDTTGRPIDTSNRQLDASGRPMDTSGRQLDASGRPMDTSGRQYDASGRPMDTSGRQFDASGRPMDTSGRQLDASGRPMDTSGRQFDASGRPMDTSGKQFDASGRPMDTSGRQLDASGRPMDASGRQLDASGRPMDTSGRQFDASGRPMDTSGRQFDASGRPMDTSGRQFDASGRPIDTSGRQFDASGRPMDTSGRQFDASGRPMDPSGRRLDPSGRPMDATGRPVDDVGGKPGKGKELQKAASDGFDRRTGSKTLSKSYSEDVTFKSKEVNTDAKKSVSEGTATITRHSKDAGVQVKQGVSDKGLGKKRVDSSMPDKLRTISIETDPGDESVENLKRIIAEQAREIEDLKRQLQGTSMELRASTDRVKLNGKELDSAKKAMKNMEDDMLKECRKLQQLVKKFQEAKEKLERLLGAEKKKNAKLEQMLKEGACMPGCLCKKLGLDSAGQGDGPLDLLAVLLKVFHSGVKSLNFNEIAQLHEETRSALARKIESGNVEIDMEPSITPAFTHDLPPEQKQILLVKLEDVEQRIKHSQEVADNEVKMLERGVIAAKRRVENMMKKEEEKEKLASPKSQPAPDTLTSSFTCHCPQ